MSQRIDHRIAGLAHHGRQCVPGWKPGLAQEFPHYRVLTSRKHSFPNATSSIRLVSLASRESSPSLSAFIIFQ
jgi:hypothetical protein